jgi:flagellar secretion chaperone FliS
MNPYASPQAYRDSAVLTASPEQLVVMLYDGAIRFLRQAEVAMNEGAWLHSFEKLSRAEAILDELLATLNMDTGEIAERLQAIYVFCKKTLIEGRIQRQGEKIGQVIALLVSLREAWAKLAEQAAAVAPASA